MLDFYLNKSGDFALTFSAGGLLMRTVRAVRAMAMAKTKYLFLRARSPNTWTRSQTEIPNIFD